MNNNYNNEFVYKDTMLLLLDIETNNNLDSCYVADIIAEEEYDNTYKITFFVYVEGKEIDFASTTVQADNEDEALEIFEDVLNCNNVDYLY